MLTNKSTKEIIFNSLRLTSNILFILVILFKLMTIFIISPKMVSNVSMVPTLKDKQWVWILPTTVNKYQLNKGDIIVLKDEVSKRTYIKRIIATTGDQVTVTENHLLLNEEPLVEPYLKEQNFETPLFVDIIIPDEQLFVCGDNRNDSFDSRNGLGLVPIDKVLGKVIFPKELR